MMFRVCCAATGLEYRVLLVEAVIRSVSLLPLVLQARLMNEARAVMVLSDQQVHTVLSFRLISCSEHLVDYRSSEGVNSQIGLFLPQTMHLEQLFILRLAVSFSQD